ncbi:hypothetical protein [Hoeflea sp.]|uniref:hypothetical protein n=1 Tax=Hoeflea sp. TaxID=1940281 RepID=UPI003747D015
MAKIGKAGVSAKDISKFAKLATADTKSKEFSKAFAEDPAMALAAKGITISDNQSAKIRKQLSNMSSADANETEIGVTVKHKF